MGNKPKSRSPRRGDYASADDPSTWCWFEEATHAYLRGIGDGIGFVLTEDDPFVRIHLDCCVDQDGRPSEDADTIVRDLYSYTERSSSGRGLQILCKGKLPEAPRRREGIEAFESGHYFTVTGSFWPDAPESIEECTEALTRFHKNYLVEPESEGEVDRSAQWASQIDSGKLDSVGVPEVVQLSSVEPIEVQWLAEPYIPLGKITFIEGDPGVGKTHVSLDMIAAVTRGQGFFGLEECTEPENCVFMTAEDGLADTIRPRLDAAGAEVDRVFVLTGIKTAEGRREFTLQDMEILRQVVLRYKPALVVIDPIQGFLGRGVDMHRANDVRPLLAGLARVGEDLGPAMVGIRHLRKSSADGASQRGLGSIDFAAAARSILRVAEVPGEPGRRVLVHLKSNLAPFGTSRVFELEGGRVTWVGESSLTADDLERRSPREPTAIDEAEQYLDERLSMDDEVAATTIFEEAKQAGISKTTINRAKRRKRIRTRREGFGSGSKVYWKLPDSP